MFRLATLLLTAAISFCSVASVKVSIAWGPCPPDEGGGGPVNKWDCASVQLPMDYSDPSKGNVTSFVRRGYVDQPTPNAVFIFFGGPGNSGSAGPGFCDYGFIPNEPGITCYSLDYRGIGYSSPLPLCDVALPPYLNPWDQAVMDGAANCLNQIIDQGKDLIPYVTNYHAALDAQSIINATRAPGSTVSIFGISYGTNFVNTLMNLPGMKADVIVLDGPVTANRWSVENNARMQSMVNLDSMRMCVNESSVCADEMGSSGHIPLMVADAVRDGTLPCLNKLPWLAKNDSNWRLSTMNNIFNGINAAVAKVTLRGPFWARLYRCSDTDAEQLQNFYDYVNGNYFFNSSAKVNTTGFTDYNFGFAMSVGLSDLFSYGSNPLNYTQVVEYNKYSPTIEGADTIASFARSVVGWPLRETNSAVYTYMKPACPVHILVGTLDANTPTGQAKWLKDFVGPQTNVTIHLVPYQSHGIVDFTNPCANKVVAEALALVPRVDWSCLLTAVPPPDWDGSSSMSTYSTNSLSKQYFGTDDLWNNGKKIDTVPTPAPVPVTSPCQCSCATTNTNDLLAAILVPAFIIMGLQVANIYFLVFKKKALAGQQSSDSDSKL